MTRNIFLDNLGLGSGNSLTHLLNECNTATDDEVDLIKHSMFYSEHQFPDLHSRRGGLSTISLNIRSINANYTEFKLLIERLNENNPWTVICLSECWLESTQNMTDFHLADYELLFTTEKSCGHGALMIYVHNQFSANPLDINENIHGWERQCIELSNKSRNSKKYAICNIFKPPNQIADNLNIVIREFSNTLSLISNRYHSANICCDFNIDLLQMYTNHYYKAFLDSSIYWFSPPDNFTNKN